MFLARILTPEDYGVFAILMIWVVVGESMANAGLGSCVVHRESLSRGFLDTVFWLNVVIAMIVIVVLTLGIILKIVGIEALTLLLIVCIILMNAAVVVPQNKLIRDFKYRQRTVISVAGVLVNGLSTLILVKFCSGYVALFGGVAASRLITSVLFFKFSKWSPRFYFDVSRYKEILGFGLPILGVSLNESIYKKVDEFLINTTEGLSSTGLMVKAKSLVGMANLVTSKPLANVLFPFVSKIKDLKKLGYYLSLIVSVFSLPLTLMSLTFLYFSNSLVLLAYGPQWLHTASILQVLTLGMVAYPLNVISAQFYKGMGKTQAMYKVDILKKSIGLSLLLLAFYLNQGLEFYAYAIVITQQLSLFLNVRYLGINNLLLLIKIFVILTVQGLSFVFFKLGIMCGIFGFGLNIILVFLSYHLLIGINIGHTINQLKRIYSNE